METFKETNKEMFFVSIAFLDDGNLGGDNYDDICDDYDDVTMTTMTTTMMMMTTTMIKV